jgi:hypothetical protein
VARPPTSHCQQLVADEDGRVVLRLIKGILTPVAEKPLHVRLRRNHGQGCCVASVWPFEGSWSCQVGSVLVDRRQFSSKSRPGVPYVLSMSGGALSSWETLVRKVNTEIRGRGCQWRDPTRDAPKAGRDSPNKLGAVRSLACRQRGPQARQRFFSALGSVRLPVSSIALQASTIQISVSIAPGRYGAWQYSKPIRSGIAILLRSRLPPPTQNLQFTPLNAKPPTLQ